MHPSQNNASKVQISPNLSPRGHSLVKWLQQPGNIWRRRREDSLGRSLFPSRELNFNQSQSVPSLGQGCRAFTQMSLLHIGIAKSRRFPLLHQKVDLKAWHLLRITLGTIHKWYPLIKPSTNIVCFYANPLISCHLSLGDRINIFWHVVLMWFTSSSRQCSLSPARLADWSGGGYCFPLWPRGSMGNTLDRNKLGFVNRLPVSIPLRPWLAALLAIGMCRCNLNRKLGHTTSLIFVKRATAQRLVFWVATQSALYQCANEALCTMQSGPAVSGVSEQWAISNLNFSWHFMCPK